MFGRSTSFALLAVMGLGAEAAAREAPAVQPQHTPQANEAADPLMLAQAREVEIFYDRYGREVLVDIYTGEVVTVRERVPVRPRYRDEWAPREEWLPERPRDYYDDRAYGSPDARREQRMRELERLPEPEPDYAYPDDRGPQWQQVPQEQPRFSARENIERQPLDAAPSVIEIPDASPGEMIEEAPRAIPDIRNPPQLGLGGASEDVAKFQILLDRVGASPGVIDGRIGDNVNKAISAYRDLTGETLRTYDKEYVEQQLQATGGDAFTDYEIQPTDVAGPFVASVPTDYGEKAQLEHMSYTSVTEKLAERFHMDERYLKALNPGVDFNRPGTIVRVANVGKPLNGEVTRIIADKGARQVRAYGADGRLVAIYPSTIGSQATPSPTGTHTVERIAVNPEYTYNPRVNFQQGNNDRVLTIPPGPNGPVGTVWIALSKPTYGIHGTPEPSQIGKTESNGCIRLTNWDAEELAKMVKPGVTVEFVE